MQETDIKLLANTLPNLPESISSQILSVEEFLGEVTVSVKRESIRSVIEFLKQRSNIECTVDNERVIS